MSGHALYVGGQWIDLTVPYQFTPPTVSPPSDVEYTPYGPAWAEDTGLRAGEARLWLSVGGTTPALAAENAQVWLTRAMSSSRVRFTPTGRFLQVLRVDEVPITPLRGGIRYEMNLRLSLLNPYWHDAAGDGSTRLLP